MPVIQRRRVLRRDPDSDLDLAQRRSLDIGHLCPRAEDMYPAIRLATSDVDPE